MKTKVNLKKNSDLDVSSSKLSLFKRACLIAHLKEEEVQPDFNQTVKKHGVRLESQPRQQQIVELSQKWNFAMIRSHKIPHRSGVLTHTAHPRIDASLQLYKNSNNDVSNTSRVSTCA